MDRITELRQLQADGTITRDQLIELRDLLRTEGQALAADGLTDEIVATLQDWVALRSQIDAEIATIVAAEAQRSADAQAALDALLAEDDAPEGEGEPVEVVAETETPVVAEPELVAASAPQPPARPAPASPVVSRVAARRPETVRPQPLVTPMNQMSLVAAANLPGVQAGADLSDPERFADAFAMAVQASNGFRGPRTNVPVARASVAYPDERMLDDNLGGNLRKINAVTSAAAIRAEGERRRAAGDTLVASGGACAPSQVLYDLPILPSTARRPVRDDMLVRFGADRGGIRVIAPPTIADADTAINTWTAATDASPGGSTKGCLTVTCPSTTETLVDAIVRCLRFGNFQARFFAEQIDAWLQVAAAQWAREAETKLLTAMGTGSTNVSSGQGLGTTRDVLAAVDRATAAIRSRHRLDPAFPFRFGVPFWLFDNMRTDLARELPGSSDERLAVADATLMRFFSVRNINVSTFLDGETGQVFGAQGTGPLTGWPSTVITYLYPEGTWLFLDGGTLDLGVVRDSTLNSTNNFQMFAESFENVAFNGVVSYRMTLDICPSGKTSAATSFDPCTVGS